jgi:hypothetical protein
MGTVVVQVAGYGGGVTEGHNKKQSTWWKEKLDQTGIFVQ